MTYPARPGPRIPYEENGTRMLISHTAGDDRTPYRCHPDAIAALNSDVGHGLWISGDWWTFERIPTGEPYHAKNFVTLVFPYPMDITGYAAALQSDWQIPDGTFSYHSSFSELTARIQVSYDTTDGMDGNWIDVSTKDENDEHLRVTYATRQVIGGSQGEYVQELPVSPDGIASSGPSMIGGSGSFWITYWNLADTGRMLFPGGPGGPGISPLSGVTNVKALRLFFPRRPDVITTERLSYGALVGPAGQFRNALMHLHLYGDKGSSTTDDRLEIRNGAGTGEPDLQWGDVDQGNTYTRSFRVKNTSSSETAVSVSVVLTATTTPEQSLPQMLALSKDESIWAPRLYLGDLAPGAVSDELFIRLNPSTDTVGLRSALVVAQAGRWT